MKKLLYVLLSNLIFICYGCSKSTIGYLEIEHAKYAINNVEILTFTSLERFIIEKQKMHDNFVANNKGLMDRLAAEQAKFDICDDERRVMSDQYYKALFAYYDYLDIIYPQYEDEKSLKLLEESSRLETVMNDYIEKVIDPITAEIETINEEILESAQELGTTPELLKKDINNKKNIISKEIPWRSTTIEGILGTNPIMYEIAGITSDTGDVEDIKKYIKIGGGGRITLSSRVNSAKGKYVVTILVSNEGKKYVLNDIYSFQLI